MISVSMANKIRSFIVACALLLAVMTAWGTHISTSLIATGHSAMAIEHAADAQDDYCSDHVHTPTMGDHQHEIPHLVRPPLLKSYVALTFRHTGSSYPLPDAPFFQIKRPPRPDLPV
jgi:hypothetical protein